MARSKFNRQVEDLGNILSLEHVNLRVPDQELAAWFYVSGLGFTRDPFVDFGSYNTWMNIGTEQFHLPTGKAQILRGEVHVVVSDLDQLELRLKRIQSRLRATKFSFKRGRTDLSVQCPWGNKIRLSAESETSRPGIKAVKLKVPSTALAGITRFYQQVFACPVRQNKSNVEVIVGIGQKLIFTASRQVPEYDGHHIAIYCPDFSTPYKHLKQHAMISEESDQHQYRFENIFDPKDGSVLFKLEHEVRSLHHPMFNRTLINRNPSQTFANYAPGRDQYYPTGN